MNKEKIKQQTQQINEELRLLCEYLNELCIDYDIRLEQLDITYANEPNDRKLYFVKVTEHKRLDK